MFNAFKTLIYKDKNVASLIAELVTCAVKTPRECFRTDNCYADDLDT